ncbi:UNVERIFIED_CONTAM: hypothetical protein Sangu_2599600 [Sesamum angustifolium]|uniref:Uncharacterized protein n=1 Tax=Sesamum angustifolium TaxID=2727405 RepID=A0AAW2J598_9LAMI
MDIEGKTKDNLNAHKDLKNICNGPELEVDERRPNATPKVAYTLMKEQKKKICEWVRGLRFPDGYASNVSRCVDIANLRLHDMKNHDCHVFVQKLIPVAFRELLPEFVWSALMEDYFEAPSVSQVLEEPTLASHVEGNYPQWDDEQHMDWAQRMVFDAAGLRYFASSHEGVPHDGTRSCPVDVGPSSYCYGDSGPYDYDESGLADRSFNVVHVVNQPLWDDCTQSQLGVVVELVDIKADCHTFERIYNRRSQWANRVLPSDHTLSGDYCSTKKLVKDLGLPVEKIHVCKNGCMYWKDDVDLSIANFVGTLGISLLEGETHTGRSLRMLSLGTFR